MGVESRLAAGQKWRYRKQKSVAVGSIGDADAGFVGGGAFGVFGVAVSAFGPGVVAVFVDTSAGRGGD